MNGLTQEAITAEINYRLERAQAAALAREARVAARRNRKARPRRWLTRAPVRHATPALP